jgi:hypothetical protein
MVATIWVGDDRADSSAVKNNDREAKVGERVVVGLGRGIARERDKEDGVQVDRE